MTIFIRAIFHRLPIIHKLLGKRTYLFAYAWGVKIGKNAAFFGRTHFYRKKKSQIIIGDNCTFISDKTTNWIGVNHPCLISAQVEGSVIIIGDNCGFSGTSVGAFKKIVLGNNVRCGANTVITDSDWHLDDPRVGEPVEVNIGDNVWLGVNSVVLKGVTIGENTIIGAGSVVTKSIPANVIAAGNPCKVIKAINQ